MLLEKIYYFLLCVLRKNEQLYLQISSLLSFSRGEPILKYFPKYSIFPFKLEELKKPGLICIVGKKGSGKTSLAHYLAKSIHAKHHFIFSENDHFSGINHKLFVASLKTKKGKKLVIFELGSESWLKIRTMSNITNNFRHLDTTVIITFENMSTIPPMMRYQVDHFFIFREQNIAKKNILYQKIGKIFHNEYQVFSDYCDMIWEKNFRTMVVDNGFVLHGTSLENIVFWHEFEK